MTRTRPPFQPKKLLLSGLSIGVLMAVSFMLNAYDSETRIWPIPLVFLAIPALICYAVPLANYRPKGEKWVLLPAIVVFVASVFPANIGGHSLWLSVFGDIVHCRVDKVVRHKSTRGSDTFSNDLVCGDRKLTFRPTKFRSVKAVGTEMDLVVDRTGFVGGLEPDQVSTTYNLIFVLGLLMNGAFMLLVARRPVRDPLPAG
jgi:hypothetical protein